MLQAQLHGKLKREEEDLEDLLTSNVFGTMQYIPYDEGILPLLRKAESERKNPFLNIGKISKIDYNFWQPLAEQNCNLCIPDVLIDITEENGNRTTILVESKYMSGKSSKANDDDENPHDQLAMEWDNLVSYANRHDSKPYLLYITADITYPKNDIEESKNEYTKKRGGNMCVLWISWRRLPYLFQKSEYKILKDLVKILKIKGLTFFEGIHIKPIKNSTWIFKDIFKDYNWKLLSKKKINWRYINE